MKAPSGTADGKGMRGEAKDECSATEGKHTIGYYDIPKCFACGKVNPKWLEAEASSREAALKELREGWSEEYAAGKGSGTAHYFVEGKDHLSWCFVSICHHQHVINKNADAKFTAEPDRGVGCHECKAKLKKRLAEIDATMKAGE